MKHLLVIVLLFGCSIGNIDAQYSSYQDSLIHIVKIDKDKYKVLNAYFDLVLDFYLEGEEEVGDAYLKKMKSFAKSKGIKSGQGYGLLLKSYQAFYYDVDVEKAIDFIINGIEQLETTADTSFLIKYKYVDALNEIGTYYESISAYDNALTYYFKSLDYAKEYNLLDMKIEVYNNLSFMYSEYFNDTNLGIKYLEYALQEAEKLDDSYTNSMLYGNLAMQYIGINDYEKSRFYLDKTIAIDKRLKDTLGLSHSYLEEARLFTFQNNFEAAQTSIDKARAFMPENCRWTTDIYLISGKIAIAFNKLKTAKLYLQEALKHARLINDLYDEYDALLVLAEFEKMNNNSLKAVDYYSKMFEVKDSIDNQWKISNAMKAESQAKVKVIQIEKEAVEFEKKLLALTINEQRKSIFLIILLLIIALVTGFIIFWQKQNLQKAYLLLVQKTQSLTIELQKKQDQINHEKLEISQNTLLKQGGKEDFLAKLDVNLPQKIQKALEVEKVFLDKKLTLTKFAELLGTNTSYLSKAINIIYDKSFRAVVNEYRIKEILIYFETEQQKELTIFALAQKAGFSSKSAFNNAFKDYTGVTPTFYLKNR